MGERIYFAANSGELGGGQTMLLTLASAARDLGRDVTVVAPEASAVIEQALEHELPVVEIHGSGSRAYMGTLRSWDDRERRGAIWCNGIVPALALAGRADRVVHLHRVPKKLNQSATRISLIGARAAVVPSDFAATRLAQARVLPNWCPEVKTTRPPVGRVPATIGFLGQPTIAKGFLVLAKAVELVNRRFPDRLRLLVAGDVAALPERDRQAVRSALVELGRAVAVRECANEEFWRAIDMAVFCSLAPESFGLPVTQAMSGRVPVAVSDVGALPEIVGADHPWIVRAGDSKQLADLFDDVLSDRSGRVTERAHARWRERYSPEVGMEGFATLLADLNL